MNKEYPLNKNKSINLRLPNDDLVILKYEQNEKQESLTREAEVGFKYDNQPENPVKSFKSPNKKKRENEKKLQKYSAYLPPFNIKYELIIDILSDYWKFENFSRRSSFLNFFSPPQQDHIKQFRQEHESMKNDLHIFVDKALKYDQVIKFIKWTEDLFIKEIGEDDNDPDARKLLKRLRDKKSKYNNSYICKYDVFLCHNNNDQTEVEKIAKNLEDKWIRPWWDNPNLSGNWHEKLSNIIKTVPSAAVFVGKYGIGPTQDMEIKRLLTENTERKRSGIRNFKITSIFLPDYDDSPLPPEIDFINAEFQNVDYRRDSEPTKKIFREITGESDFPV